MKLHNVSDFSLPKLSAPIIWKVFLSMESNWKYSVDATFQEEYTAPIVV